MSRRQRMLPGTWCVVQPDGAMLAHHDSEFVARRRLQDINAWRLSSRHSAPGTAAVLMTWERYQEMFAVRPPLGESPPK